MRRQRTVESRRDRMEMAAEAGYPKISFVSVLAGVLVAYGAFAIIAGITGAVMNGLGVDTRALSDNDWRQLGIGTGIAVAVSLFLSYLFGGYVAGRMARRGGAMNGLLVFVLGILLAIGVGAALGTQTDGDDLLSNLRSIGVPTSGEEYSAIGTIAGIAALASMLLGAVLGGIAGERWHGKLLTRALDPTIGPDHTTDERRSDDTTEVRSSGRHYVTDGDDRTRDDRIRDDRTRDDRTRDARMDETRDARMDETRDGRIDDTRDDARDRTVDTRDRTDARTDTRGDDPERTRTIRS